jgi:hypothetical protein
MCEIWWWRIKHKRQSVLDFCRRQIDGTLPKVLKQVRCPLEIMLTCVRRYLECLGLATYAAAPTKNGGMGAVAPVVTQRPH